MDSPAITKAKAVANATDYVRKYGPDETLWCHMLDWREATSTDWQDALRLIEARTPEATSFIAHLRTMRDVAS